jgi:hypothetical protein
MLKVIDGGGSVLAHGEDASAAYRKAADVIGAEIADLKTISTMAKIIHGKIAAKQPLNDYERRVAMRLSPQKRPTRSIGKRSCGTSRKSTKPTLFLLQYSTVSTSSISAPGWKSTRGGGWSRRKRHTTHRRPTSPWFASS